MPVVCLAAVTACACWARSLLGTAGASRSGCWAQVESLVRARGLRWRRAARLRRFSVLSPHFVPSNHVRNPAFAGMRPAEGSDELPPRGPSDGGRGGVRGLGIRTWERHSFKQERDFALLPSHLHTEDEPERYSRGKWPREYRVHVDTTSIPATFKAE